VTPALAVIGLLTFGLSPAAVLAKVPQSGKNAPQHGTATPHKKSTDAAQGDTAKPRAATSKAKAAQVTPATHRKATAARTKSSTAHAKAARTTHRPAAHRKTAAHKRTVHKKGTAHRTSASHTRTTAHTAKTARRRPLRELIAAHATHYGVPQHLVRRVISAESGYNSKARNGPYIGLMQIALPTARGLGYSGTATGLTDPDTNLRYGVAYLANAYRIAHGDEDAAMRLYRRGYYYEAKRQGMVGELIAAR
jgi:soluble lytic murein transglycosylase-like protein